MSFALKLIFVFALQAGALAFMIADKQYTLATGTPIVLETEPVDPRSLFSGDYVRLRYAVSALDLDKLAGDQQFEPHQHVFVTLTPGQPYWTPVGVYRARPTASAGKVVLRGTAESIAESRWNRDGHHVIGRFLNVRYGVENYFVPEGAGLALERPALGETVSIRLAVDKRGNASIQGVLVNGQERYVETLW